MRRSEASRELLAPRGDVWAFLAEPHHLADWWPRVRAVQPDRRGFSPGARWHVVASEQFAVTSWRDPKRPKTLVIVEIEPFERWTWHLTGPAPIDVEIRLAAPAADRTLVAIAVAGSALASPKRLSRTAVDRLYDLVQTAAEL